MKLSVKILQGSELSIEVNSSATVLDIKNAIERVSAIPVREQRLMLNGRPLLDEKTASASGLLEGSKIVLAVKRAAGSEDNASNSGTKEDFWTHFHRLLLRHFKKDDADKMLVECQKSMSQSIQRLSLDDVERLAKTALLSAASSK